MARGCYDLAMYNRLRDLCARPMPQERTAVMRDSRYLDGLNPQRGYQLTGIRPGQYVEAHQKLADGPGFVILRHLLTPKQVNDPTYKRDDETHLRLQVENQVALYWGKLCSPAVALAEAAEHTIVETTPKQRVAVDTLAAGALAMAVEVEGVHLVQFDTGPFGRTATLLDRGDALLWQPREQTVPPLVLANASRHAAPPAQLIVTHFPA